MDNSDVQLALLYHRNTPRSADISSPCQRLMSRSTRVNIPVAHANLKPKIEPNVTTELSTARAKQKKYADRGSTPGKSMEIGDRVQLQVGNRNWSSGYIKEKSDKPRSFIVDTDDGKTLRRNSSQIRKSIVPDSVISCTAAEKPPSKKPIDTTTTIPKTSTEPRDTPPANTESATSKTTTSNQVVTRYGRVVKPVQHFML